MKSTTFIRTGGLVVMTALSASLWLSSGFGAHAAGGGIAGVEERADLQICVARPDGSNPGGEAMSKLRRALSDVQAHPQFKPAGLDANGGPKLVAGCPSPSTLHTKEWGGRRVSRPGAFHAYVFLASEEDLGDNIFKRDRVTVQERMCEHQRCASVSNALYVTPDVLADEDRLSRALATGIGLAVDESPARDGAALTADEKPAP